MLRCCGPVVIVAAAALVTTFAELASEDAYAECDDVGLSQLPYTRMRQRQRGKALDEQRNSAVDSASVGAAQQNHRHRHVKKHVKTRSSHAKVFRRRRRRHDIARVLPPAEMPGERADSNITLGARSSSAGVTFIQISSRLNATLYEEPPDDVDANNVPVVPMAVAAATPDPSNQTTTAPKDADAAEARPFLDAEAYHMGALDPMHISLALLALVTLSAAISLCALISRFFFHRLAEERLMQGTRNAETVHVTKGAALEIMFASHNQRPLSPGRLTRIQGRVVPSTLSSLASPLSGQPCVMYAASVSHPRQDGIHHPIAFRSESTDFVVALSDSPHLRIAIHSHDVALFDMVGGMMSRKSTLSEAPDTWRNFILTNCVPGNDAATGSALGHDGSLLEFRESALIDGVEVTCIGEIARDRNGNLGLFPWRPPSTSVPASIGGSMLLRRRRRKNDSSDQGRLDKAIGWIAAATRLSSAEPVVRRECVMGRVMVSDDPAFLM